ncbi:MAG: GDP-mannose 4,6-dehydratase [Casimicrobiaceae bacterium]
MRTLLLTGHTGFVGRTISGVLLAEPGDRGWRLATLPEDCDLRSPALVERVAGLHPDAVVHLAARTSVSESFDDPEGYFDVNFHGTWNLLRALRAGGFRGRMLYVSSGDCYGKVQERALPVTEDQPLRPRSPYAVSKVAAEALCYQWSQTEAFDVVIARPFNHIGPGQDLRFAAPTFARQVVRICSGLEPPRILTGDLEVTRDMTDVRDVATAYFALLEHADGGEVYNVGSGRETPMRDVLNGFLAIAGIEAEIVVDPQRLRPDEQRRAVADVRKLERDTGWRAVIPLDITLRDMLDDWTRRVAHE